MMYDIMCSCMVVSIYIVCCTYYLLFCYLLWKPYGKEAIMLPQEFIYCIMRLDLRNNNMATMRVTARGFVVRRNSLLFRE